ncbi:MAG TPA: hypothetical protein VGG56_12760 [Terracidiphilus sp.]
MAAVEIQDCSIGQQPPQSGGVLKRNLSFSIVLSEGPIKPGDRQIAQEHIDEVSVASFLNVAQPDPIALTEQHRHPGGGKRIDEGHIFPEILFQLRQWKSRIDREKSSFRIRGRQKDVLLAASRLQTVAKNAEQISRMIAVGNLNHAGGTGEHLKFSRLLEITFDENQELCRFSVLIAFDEDIAREQRQHFSRKNLLTDACHALKRSQGARNVDRLFRCGDSSSASGIGGRNSRGRFARTGSLTKTQT